MWIVSGDTGLVIDQYQPILVPTYLVHTYFYALYIRYTNVIIKLYCEIDRNKTKLLKGSELTLN